MKNIVMEKSRFNRNILTKVTKYNSSRARQVSSPMHKPSSFVSDLHFACLLQAVKCLEASRHPFNKASSIFSTLSSHKGLLSLSPDP